MKAWQLLVGASLACFAYVAYDATHRQSVDAVVAKAPAIPPAATVRTTLLFPEWTNSASAFERVAATNLWAVCSNGQWRVKWGAALQPVWGGDPVYPSIKEAREPFALNISWHVNRALYDALSPAIKLEVR